MFPLLRCSTEGDLTRKDRRTPEGPTSALPGRAILFHALLKMIGACAESSTEVMRSLPQPRVASLMLATNELGDGHSAWAGRDRRPRMKIPAGLEVTNTLFSTWRGKGGRNSPLHNFAAFSTEPCLSACRYIYIYTYIYVSG